MPVTVFGDRMVSPPRRRPTGGAPRNGASLHWGGTYDGWAGGPPSQVSFEGPRVTASYRLGGGGCGFSLGFSGSRFGSDLGFSGARSRVGVGSRFGSAFVLS